MKRRIRSLQRHARHKTRHAGNDVQLVAQQAGARRNRIVQQERRREFESDHQRRLRRLAHQQGTRRRHAVAACERIGIGGESVDRKDIARRHVANLRHSARRAQQADREQAKTIHR